MHLNNEKFHNGEDICNAFAKYFGSVISNDAGTNPNMLHNVNAPEVVINEIGIEEILSALRDLKDGKAVGMDSLPTFLFKGFSDFLSFTNFV